ncbi:hypothetical protein RFI_19678 [Reticulomyxa filosa]|uniref:Uncharacterized protein n=1 Tax=Reticulomyxa filosa TaxID=46433 RepID=X6MUH8_RETFI|nr:hypothetical protein RFI_19678 [Reticulomyxa filosa]|eukprot:ETO17643.1 hypothetical protein RFI_19678 [Reticulomyxa filosa]
MYWNVSTSTNDSSQKLTGQSRLFGSSLWDDSPFETSRSASKDKKKNQPKVLHSIVHIFTPFAHYLYNAYIYYIHILIMITIKEMQLRPTPENITQVWEEVKKNLLSKDIEILQVIETQEFRDTLYESFVFLEALEGRYIEKRKQEYNKTKVDPQSLPLEISSQSEQIQSQSQSEEKENEQKEENTKTEAEAETEVDGQAISDWKDFQLSSVQLTTVPFFFLKKKKIKML